LGKLITNGQPKVDEKPSACNQHVPKKRKTKKEGQSSSVQRGCKYMDIRKERGVTGSKHVYVGLGNISCSAAVIYASISVDIGKSSP